MARRSSRSSSKGGNTLYGLLAGLLLGLIVAAVVAFYVTKAPIPFMDRAGRAPAPAPVSAQSNQPLPDPNRGLQGNSAAPDTRQPTPAVPGPVASGSTTPALPATPPDTRNPDELGALIASLPGHTPAAAPAAAAAAAPKLANGAAASAYFLQVGSYQILEDAESLRARLLLQGLPVQIQRAEVNGLQVNRVRIGPYTQLDEMNRTRTKLASENIPSTVVRQ